MLGVLATKIGLPAALVDSSCTALCDAMRGAPLSAIESAEFRDSDNSTRCRELGEQLLLTSAKKGSNSIVSDDTADAAANEKMCASAAYKELHSELEKLDVSPTDYLAVVQTLASTALGRVYIAEGKAASAFLNRFKAARGKAELDASLNELLAIDERGDKLHETVIAPGIASSLIKGNFNPKAFDPWRDLVRKVIEVRDGRSAAAREQNSANGEFWADHSRLELSEKILPKAMAFIGHGGRDAGSYLSFHKGMAERARHVYNLPADLIARPGLQRQLIAIGTEAMEYAASRDATMIKEPVHLTALPSPFMPASSAAARNLTQFDNDLAAAQRDVRLHDKYGRERETVATRFQQPDRASASSNSRGHRSEATFPTEPAVKRARSQGCQLSKWGAHTCELGPIYGGKFLVTTANGNTDGKLTTGGCLGCTAFPRDSARRAEWCSMGSCTDHPRPAGVAEDDIVVINLYATNNSTAHADLARKATDAKASWQHVAGPDTRDVVMGGIGGGSATQHFSPGDRGGRGGGQRHAGYAGGLPTLSQLRGAIAKGRGKGKGKGGRGASSFGRQRN